MMIIIAIFYFNTKYGGNQKPKYFKMLKKSVLVPDFTGQFNLGRRALKALSCAQWDSQKEIPKTEIEKIFESEIKKS